MHRRHLLQLIAGGAMLSMLPAPLAQAQSGASATAPAKRPNILFAISDDQSWAHTGAYGDPTVKTPIFDRLAREGALFQRAYCSSPSCSPSRASILTGQDFWRLEEGANLWATLPAKFAVYPEILETAGYHVGSMGKGYGPGRLEPGGRTRPPSGRYARNFAEFMESVPSDKPFCFWFGPPDPHRPYETGAGLTRFGLKDVTVPKFLPDNPVVRSDIADYLFEIERFDRNVGAMLQLLEQKGELDNTIVVLTSDNGMPFPRAKGNLYDYGAHMPLAIRWPSEVRGGRVVEEFVNNTDFAPTFLQAAGVTIPTSMTGRSLLPLLRAETTNTAWRDSIVLGRERHTDMRDGGVGYPVRAIRTREYSYLRNFEPQRWPAGDPDRFGDIDGGPTKTFMLEQRNHAGVQRQFDLAFGKRPAEELYDLKNDPLELNNLAADARYAATKQQLRREMEKYLAATGDPRVLGGGERFDQYPYLAGTDKNGRPLQTTKAQEKS